MVTISSVASTYGGSTVNYSAAKGEVVGLTKSLAREWAGQRINVNSIAPGRVTGTEIGKPAPGESAPPSHPTQEPPIPIGRPRTPEDIGDLTAYLARPRSDFLTGKVVEIHGGLPMLPRPDGQPG